MERCPGSGPSQSPRGPPAFEGCKGLHKVSVQSFTGVCARLVLDGLSLLIWDCRRRGWLEFRVSGFGLDLELWALMDSCFSSSRQRTKLGISGQMMCNNREGEGRHKSNRSRYGHVNIQNNRSSNNNDDNKQTQPLPLPLTRRRPLLTMNY